MYLDLRAGLAEQRTAKMTTVTNQSGKEIDFDAAIEFMDDDIMETLHDELAPCTEQKFFTAYEKAHEEKHGDEWFLSGSNPVW
jgi:hypothetical protein